jgi:hypothetical protein
MKRTAFWDTAPSSPVGIDRRFRGAYCLIALMMKTISAHEMVQPPFLSYMNSQEVILLKPLMYFLYSLFDAMSSQSQPLWSVYPITNSQITEFLVMCFMLRGCPRHWARNCTVARNNLPCRAVKHFCLRCSLRICLTATVWKTRSFSTSAPQETFQCFCTSRQRIPPIAGFISCAVFWPLSSDTLPRTPSQNVDNKCFTCTLHRGNMKWLKSCTWKTVGSLRVVVIHRRKILKWWNRWMDRM